MPPPSLPTMTWMRGSRSAGGSSSAPTSCSSARSPSTTRVTPARPPAWLASGDAHRGRDRAVDAGEAAVRVHRHLLAAEHRIGDAHQPRRPEHEPIVRPGGPPHRVDERRAVERAPGWRRARRRSRRAAPRAPRTRARRRRGRAARDRRMPRARRCSHAPSHSRSASPGGDRQQRRPRHGRVVEVQRLARAAHRDHLEVGVGQQRRHFAAERGMPEHDDPLDAPAERRDPPAVRGSRARGCGRTARR